VQAPRACTFGQVMLSSGLWAVQRGGVLLRGTDLPRPHSAHRGGHNMVCVSQPPAISQASSRSYAPEPIRAAALRRDLPISVIGAAPRRLRVMVTGIPPEKVAHALRFWKSPIIGIDSHNGIEPGEGPRVLTLDLQAVGTPVSRWLSESPFRKVYCTGSEEASSHP
jgi:hypothetical protein